MYVVVCCHQSLYTGSSPPHPLTFVTSAKAAVIQGQCREKCLVPAIASAIAALLLLLRL